MHRSKVVLAGLLIATPAFAQGDGTGSGDGTTTGDGTGGGGGDGTGAPTGGESMPAPTVEPEAPMKKMTVGADLAFILPLGDYADGVSAAIGVLGRFEFAVNAQLAVTGRLGYIYNVVKDAPDGYTLSMIPVMAGAAYKIGTSGLFAYGEVGLTNIRVSLDVGGMSFSDSETKLSIGAGAGYAMGKIKGRVGFYMPGSLSDDDGMGGSTTTTLFGIMASGGYDFASF